MSKVPPLVGLSDAAAILGVHRSNLMTVKGLPEPVQRVSSGPLWLRSEIEALAIRREAKKL